MQKLPSENQYGLNDFFHRWIKDHPPALTFTARTQGAASDVGAYYEVVPTLPGLLYILK